MEENVIYSVFLFIVIPLLMTLLFADKKSKGIFSFLIVGITVCLIASELNNILMNAFNCDFFWYSVTVSPIVEEILKALPLAYAVFVLFERLDEGTCISFGLAIGIGFALFENIVVYFQNGSEESLWWALIRGIGAGLMHGLCGGAMGFGLCFIKKFTGHRLFGVVSILSAIIIYHGLYNLLVQAEQFKIVGFVLPAVTCAVFVPINLWYVKSRKPRADNAQSATAAP